MNIYETQKKLMEKIGEKTGRILLRDNILPPLPEVFPYVALDAGEAMPAVSAGGTLPLQHFVYDIYVVDALARNRDSLPKTRQSVCDIVDKILSTERVYANSVTYGEDVIGTHRCSIARIRCSFPI